MTYLIHITLDTGDAHRSEREEQNPAAIEAAGQILRRALHPPMIPVRWAEMLVEQGAGDVVPALDIALQTLQRPTLDAGLHRSLQGWTLMASAEGKALLCTICAAQHNAPVVTFGVALNSRAGAGLWRILHDDIPGRGPVATDPEQPPASPWLGSRMEGGIALLGEYILRRAVPLLADFQTCIAWTWFDSHA